MSINWLIKYSKQILLGTILLVFIAVCSIRVLGWKSESISFNKEVRPILNAKCTGCHGGVKKAGGISFIYRELALSKGESGKECIVPGKPDESEFIKRLTHHDAELRMPLGKEQLSKEEIEILRNWVEEGAVWEEHWAYVKPIEQIVPDAASKFVKNEIDNFIIAKREELDIPLTPSELADKATLLRRASLDLTGLPPTLEELNGFENDPSPNAFEKQIDRLLESPAFGEKWAAMWLDLARYADTKGYEKDQHRNIWRYRDYVIKSFNNNKPYNLFLTEQLAGDLLPNKGEEQILATAFHRNTLNNDEGGTDDEEFRTASVIDRVNSTFDITQGITMGCVQCHSHPYDPIDHKEYYKFMAFMNNTADKDHFDEIPNYISKQDTPTVRIKELMTMIDKLNGFNSSKETYEQMKRRHSLPRVQAEHCTEMKNAKIEGPYAMVSTPESFLKYSDVDFSKIESIKVRASSSGGSSVTVHLDSPNGKQIAKFELLENFGEWFEYGEFIAPVKGKHDVFFRFHKNSKGFCNSSLDYINFNESKEEITLFKRNGSAFDEQKNISKAQKSIYWIGPDAWVSYNNIDLSKSKHIAIFFTAAGGSKLEFRLDSPTGELIGEAEIASGPQIYKLETVKIKPTSGTHNVYVLFKKDKKGNYDGIIEYFDFNKRIENNISKINKALKIDSLKSELQSYLYDKGTPVMQELEGENRRITRVFHRGNWMDKKDTVLPDVPKILNTFPISAPKNRLGMAQWLTSSENPLTARVAVNRFWEQLFGYGIVETLEDFGTQGSKPTHPELLDYLAIKFQKEMKWDVKKLLKFFVMSYTYQQKSEVNERHLKYDSRNRYLARAPRVRLSSEQIRDQALAVSGLLSKKMYGRSVMPYQPEGIWQTVYNGSNWETSPGEDRYRRMIYTYIRRSSPFPNMFTFDAPSREFCVVRRIRTNTPLQALATLNDTTFTEASQALARKMVSMKDTAIRTKISVGFKLATLKEPKLESVKALVGLYKKADQFYTKNPQKALKMAGCQTNSKEIAAYTLVANAILNTDEFITKE